MIGNIVQHNIFLTFLMSYLEDKAGPKSVGMWGPILRWTTLIQVSQRRIIVLNWMLNVDNMHTLEAFNRALGSTARTLLID